MKVIFFVYKYIPFPDANGNCIQALRKQMLERGIRSDVLTFRHTKKTPAVQEDPCGKIYQESCWTEWMSTGRSAGRSKGYVLLRTPIALLARIVHRMFSGPYTLKEKGGSWKACKKVRKKLEALCKSNGYDWVVAVSSPYCIHEIASRANLYGAKLALYYFDPYSTHQMFSERNRERRMHEEIASVKKSDVVFASLEHRTDWMETDLHKYIDKACFIPYPNLYPKDKEECRSIQLQKNAINLIYIGTLQDRVRYPGAMFSLFEKMISIEPILRLYVVGYKNGTKVKQQVRDAQERLGESLICTNAVFFQQAMDLIDRSDCVINLGNCMTNQMPSKLIDYIAAGKPIINISHNRPCNTELYTTRYPWTLQFYEDDLTTDDSMCDAAASAVQFVREHQGKCLPWETIEKDLSGFTSKDVAEQFLKALEKTTS